MDDGFSRAPAVRRLMLYAAMKGLPFPSVILASCLLIPAAPAEPVPLVMRVAKQGLIEGYPAGAKTADGKAAYFESSAVATDGTTAWFMGDKPAPEKLSSVVSVTLSGLNKAVVPFAEVKPVTGAAGAAFAKVSKIESATVTEEGVRFAATAFDRFVPEANTLDPFNVILAWRGVDTEKAAVVNPLTLNGVTSSIALRMPLRTMLQDAQWPKGPPYFKMEGMAALPGKRLWLGIRESGESAEKFSYRFTVLETKWEEKEGRIGIAPEFRKVLEVTPEQLGAAGVSRTEGVGISSLEYDAERGIVWAVASWEEETTDGAWLLALTAPTEAGQAPQLLPVRDAEGKPVSFPYKVEGLCVVDARTLLVTGDEDRRATAVQTPEGPKTREPHTGVWAVLEAVVK